MAVDPLLGEIIMFAGNFAPRGWAFCDGQIMSIQQNDALFSLLGTMYGGDGRTTFALPDLRGRVPFSAGTGPGLTPYNQGQQGGVENVTLQTQHLPSHKHPIPPANNDFGSSTPSTADLKVYAGAGDTNDPSKAKSLSSQIGKGITATERLSTEDAQTIISDVVTGIQTGSASIPTETGYNGSNSAHYNMQPFLAIRFIIATEGQYPARN